MSSSSWVSVGNLRVDLGSQLASLVQHVVLTGHDRDDVGVLVFPSAAGAADAARLEQAVQAMMRARRDAGAGSSQCPTRAMMMDTVPDAEAGEMTDKD